MITFLTAPYLYLHNIRLSQTCPLDPLAVYRLSYVRSECTFQLLNGRGLFELYGCSRFRINKSVKQLLVKELLKEDYHDLGN